MSGSHRYTHFTYTAVRETKTYSQSVHQQTPPQNNWDELVAAALPYFKPALSMERKQGRMRAVRSSHIFTSACLSVHNMPSKFPFQPLGIHFGKNKIEDAIAIKDKMEG